MSREEDAIRATTRAIAATVREVPPLELEPAPGELWSPGRGPRRARRGGSGHRALPWLAPVAAAAVVVAVAVSLVLVRGIPNESVVPPSPPATAGPGGVPRYYIALDPEAASHVPPNGLLVGDTVTGQTLAVIPPPAHMSYESVTAAADDRTFLAFAAPADGPLTTGRWYVLHLAPGTTHLVSLTSTAIGPQSGVAGSALSGSGQYLAVAERGPAKGQRLIVFSLATGHPVHAWSTTYAPGLWGPGGSLANLLTWTDDDRAITFSADIEEGVTPSLRRLNFPGRPGDSDLMADSQLLWSSSAKTGWPCRSLAPVVSADGHTIACAATDVGRPSAGHVQWTFTWRSYQASAPAPAADQYAIAYQVTQQLKQGGNSWMASTLWVSPSGAALIGEWTVGHVPAVTPRTVHVGLISHGTFTPLPLPQHILSLGPQAIAW